MSEVDGLRVVSKGVKMNLGDEAKKPKKTRVCPYFEEALLKKLKRISVAIDKRPAETLLEISETFLNHPEWVKYIQKKHNVDPNDPLYVKPQIKDGKIIY